MSEELGILYLKIDFYLGINAALITKLKSIFRELKNVIYLVFNVASDPYFLKKKMQVNLIRKYHNHIPQTNPRHREEEQQNTDCHNTPGRQLK